MTRWDSPRANKVIVTQAHRYGNGTHMTVSLGYIMGKARGINQLLFSLPLIFYFFNYFKKNYSTFLKIKKIIIIVPAFSNSNNILL